MNLAILDFETLGLHPNTVVLTAGLTWFDPDKEYTIDQLLNQSIEIPFDINSQKTRTIDGDTIKWWSLQNNDARAAAFNNGTTYDLKDGALLIKEFITQHNIEGLIGNGAGFDNVILKNICNQVGIDYPIHYGMDLDLRTMKWISGMDKPDFPKELTPHKASHDSVYEARCFITYRNRLKFLKVV